MGPGVLHTRGQSDGGALRERGARDVDVVMREIGADVRIERDLLRRRLGG